MATGALRPRDGSVARQKVIGWPRRLKRAAFWPDFGAVCGLVAIWTGALWLFALLASYLAPSIYPPATAAEFFQRVLLQGEALWHVWIGQRGYAFTPGQSSTAAFPPLLALLLRAVVTVIGSWALAGALVTHAALIGALAYLTALVRLDYEQPVVWRALVAVLLWPAAPFLGAVYPEALLLLAVTAALYHARRGQWWLAALWGAFASLARGAGLAVLLPLAIEWWQQTPRGERSPRERLLALLPLLLVPLPFLIFLGYLAWQTGAPFAFFEAQRTFGQGALLHPQALATLAHWREILARTAPLVRGYPAGGVAPGLLRVHELVDLGTLALGGAAGLWLWRRVRVSYGAFVLAGAATVAFFGGVPGMARHLLALAPLYLALACWTRRPVAAYLVALLGLMLSALTMYLFVNGYWAG
jgi:hypothetical protein